MPCAAGELCLIPDVTLEPPDGYVCGGGCGGRLHEQCGNVEQVESIDDGSSETFRICTSCASKKPAAGSSSSSAGKRKATGSTILGGGSGKAKKAARGGASKRTQLTLRDKIEILGLLKKKTTHAEVARRFKCGTSTVSKVAEQRKALEQAAAAGARQDSARERGGLFPEVDKRVMAFIEESRKHGLPVTRATIQSFGHAAKKAMLASETTAATEKEKLKGFGASENWAKKFVSRNGLVSTTLHGEAGSVDPEAIEAGMAAVREMCKEYDLESIFVEEANPSDDEPELLDNHNGDDGTGRAGGGKGPPPFSELSSFFGPLENFAESSGNVEAGNFLRKAKMSFLSAYVSKPARQADIREFS